MKLTVHGSRGSIPISSPQSVGYGGNTSCYELLFDDYQLIFDTGTGFRQVSIDQFKRTFIFYSHWHHDHIQGLAFNSGIFNEEKKIHICSALNNKMTSRNLVHQYFSGFYFPIELIETLPNLIFLEFNEVQRICKQNFSIETLMLNHPGGAVGYSIKWNEFKISFLLDNGYSASQFSNLRDFVHESSLVVWDGMFLSEELVTKGLWGHSSIEQGIEFFQRCNITKMLITHHDPLRSDQELDAWAEKLPYGVRLARDGLIEDFT